MVWAPAGPPDSNKACVCVMFTQVAGVEGRHVVLLVSDNHITDEAMLADINGLLNTGEVTGVKRHSEVHSEISLLTQKTQRHHTCPKLMQHSSWTPSYACT